MPPEFVICERYGMLRAKVRQVDCDQPWRSRPSRLVFDESGRRFLNTPSLMSAASADAATPR